MILFYCQDIEGDRFKLIDQEARHCIQVLRMRTGDQITATDGKGNQFIGQIESTSKREVSAVITDTKRHEPVSRTVHLVIAPTKNTSRMEWLVEKTSEIGVSSIQPIICQRSERRQLKTARLSKILISASKQSMRFHFPTLHEPMTYIDYIDKLNSNAYIAHYQPANKNLWTYNYLPAPCVMLIGPEGDFTDEEVDRAKEKSAIPVNLGSHRLRTETAGIVSVSTLLQLPGN